MNHYAADFGPVPRPPRRSDIVRDSAVFLVLVCVGGCICPASKSRSGLDADRLLQSMEYFARIDAESAPPEHREFIRAAKTMVREGILPDRPVLFSAIHERGTLCLAWLERDEGHSAVTAIRFEDARPNVLGADVAVPPPARRLVATEGYIHYMLLQIEVSQKIGLPRAFRGHVIRDGQGMVAGMRVVVPPGWLESGRPRVYLCFNGYASNELTVFCLRPARRLKRRRHES